MLLGLFVSLKAVAYWLDQYGLAIHNGSLITGITYTDVNAVLPSKTVLMIISIISALLFFGNVCGRVGCFPCWDSGCSCCPRS